MLPTVRKAVVLVDSVLRPRGLGHELRAQRAPHEGADTIQVQRLGGMWRRKVKKSAICTV